MNNDFLNMLYALVILVFVATVAGLSSTVPMSMWAYGLN